MFNRDAVTVGKSKHGYISIDLNNLTSFIGENYTLNDRKYMDCLKKSKQVYTVVGIVLNNYNDFQGYIVSSNKGELKLMKEDKLLELLKKYSCVNYSVYSNDGVNYFVRKNPKAEVRYFDNKSVKEKLGYGFDDFDLRSDMSLKELDFCMLNNGFKLAFQRIFPVEYFGKEHRGYHLVYFNKEGIQIVINYVLDIERPLNYYSQTCVVLRDVDYKKYHRYIKENPYYSGSSSPLEDVREKDVDLTHGKMLFTFTNLPLFLFIVRKVKSYSKVVSPYKLGSNLYGIHSLLHRTPKQDSEIKDFCEKNGMSDYKYVGFIRQYVGYMNLLNYDDSLKRFYSNIFDSLLEYFQMYGETNNISVEDMRKMENFAKNCI